MSKANSIYPWDQPSYSRVVFHLWRVWEKLSGRSLAVKSSVMSRQKLACQLSFVSPHFSTETLSLSYMPELILTTRPLESGVHVLCRSYFKCLYRSLLEHFETCPSMCPAVCAPSCTHEFRQQDENKTTTTNVVSFFTCSNQSLAMHTSHLQLRVVIAG